MKRVFKFSKSHCSLYKIVILLVLISTKNSSKRRSQLKYLGEANNFCQYDILFKEETCIKSYKVFRCLDKKSKPNFIAKYTYGNKQKKGLKNFHLNIRSLKNKIPEVKNIINNDSPHIFGLSEVELFKASVEEKSLKIPGYDILFPKSWQSQGYARVVVYIKKSLTYEQVNNLENDDVQSIWIRSSFKNCKKTYFCHAYRAFRFCHKPKESTSAITFTTGKCH